MTETTPTTPDPTEPVGAGGVGLGVAGLGGVDEVLGVRGGGLGFGDAERGGQQVGARLACRRLRVVVQALSICSDSSGGIAA